MDNIGKSAPAGKGDRPRRVKGDKYRDNYDSIVWKSEPKEKIRPIFVVCTRCYGVGFVLFESFEFAGFEEPTGLIRTKCEMCDGTGEIIKRQ